MLEIALSFGFRLINIVPMIRNVLAVLIFTACLAGLSLSNQAAQKKSALTPAVSVLKSLPALSGIYINELAEDDERRIDIEVWDGELYAIVDGTQEWPLAVSKGRLYAEDDSPFDTESIMFEVIPAVADSVSKATIWFFNKPYVRVQTKGVCAGAGNFAPTLSYTMLDIDGWNVMLACGYESDAVRRHNIIREVTGQLQRIEQAVPMVAIQRVKNTIFWVEYPYHEDTDASYHTSLEWLVDNGLNPDKVGGIELDYNVYEWHDEQPWTIFHELSHAYHAKVLGDDNQAVLEVFDKAIASGAYEQVRHNSGYLERAYALSNEFEYFAEISEAYFGVNDFQPFNREELEHFDPIGYQLVERMWLVARD